MLHVLQIFDYFLSFCASLEEVAWRVVSDNFDIDVVQHFLKEKDPTQGYYWDLKMWSN